MIHPRPGLDSVSGVEHSAPPSQLSLRPAGACPIPYETRLIPRAPPRVSEPAPKTSQTSKTPKCGKLVKLCAHGTKVLSLIPHDFHPYTRKDIWRVFVLDLVS
jgi:hypothetical protein